MPHSASVAICIAVPRLHKRKQKRDLPEVSLKPAESLQEKEAVSYGKPKHPEMGHGSRAPALYFF